jgi:hypothetical protein
MRKLLTLILIATLLLSLGGCRKKEPIVFEDMVINVSNVGPTVSLAISIQGGAAFSVLMVQPVTQLILTTDACITHNRKSNGLVMECPRQSHQSPCEMLEVNFRRTSGRVTITAQDIEEVWEVYSRVRN